MGKESVCTSFQCTKIEGHCVKADKGEKGGSNDLASTCGENDLLMALVCNIRQNLALSITIEHRVSNPTL